MKHIPIRLSLTLLLLPTMLWPTYGVAKEVKGVRVSLPFTQLREAPSAKSRSVALVYGNDLLAVQADRGDWFKVKTARDEIGWIAANQIQPGTGEQEPLRSSAKALDFATDMRTTGRNSQARESLFDVIRYFPNTREAYQATRDLLSYYPLEQLPEANGKEVEAEYLVKANRLVPDLLVLHGEDLLKEKRYAPAIKAFEEGRSRGADQARCTQGLHTAMVGNLRAAVESANGELITTALIAYKDYFPQKPLPRDLAEKLVPEVYVSGTQQPPAEAHPPLPAGPPLLKETKAAPFNIQGKQDK